MNRHEVGVNDNQYRRILVGLDGSATAERALPSVEALAREHDATVTLMQVVTPIESMVFAGTVLEPMSTRRYADLVAANIEARDRAIEYLEELGDGLADTGISVEHAAPEGTPARVIVDEARRRDVDLIVMTTHGRSGLGRLVFGSVAEDVLRNAPCPVLLIPARDEIASDERRNADTDQELEHHPGANDRRTA